MVCIALIHSGKSFMPEVAAYQYYFFQSGITANVLINPSQAEMEPYDILWFFMGIQFYLNELNRKKYIVHEYCSASTPPLARIKDLIKKTINAKPSLRISLVSEHQGSLFPVDGVPLVVRKQGVHSCFFKKMVREKEYDFIYSGSASTIRKTDEWLDRFVVRFPRRSIILVGNHEFRIVEQFRSKPNIHFQKAVAITSLPDLLARARFAVNYVPDIYPFNLQPSTKFLEYCAAGCHIVSNRYEWITNFVQQKQVGVLFLPEGNADKITFRDVEAFGYSETDMSEYTWETIFEEMQLKRFLSW